MGKLAYVNRKIDGKRLSEVVARDIMKRVVPNVSYKVALRDPVVDLDVSGKSIDDEGLEIISKALITAINQQSPGRALILEEVSLKNNKLSATGLVALATVILACSLEMRNLDLSDNSIEIRTDEDALAWETFLQSFARCTTLRRLELSGNKLGQKGFEILSKVWAAEEGVIVCEETGVARGCGLQSIPYICLADTGLTDIGSVYLSYILESHKFVHELLPLVPQARPGAQTHQLEALDEVEGCAGLIWKPNSEISNLGVKVLELAEVLRKKRKDLQDQDVTDTQLASAVNELEISTSPHPLNDTRARRDSMISIDDSFHIDSSNVAGEISRARSKVQLDALKHGGIAQNELWISAFKMLRYMRIILFQPNDKELAFNLPSCASSLASTGLKSQRAISQEWPSLKIKTPTRKVRALSLRVVSSGTSKKTALAVGNPNAPLSLKSPSSKAEHRPQLSVPNIATHRRKPSQERTVVERLTTEVREQYNFSYRTTLPAGFTEDVWIEIITYAADAQGVVRDSQKISMIKWGANRESLLTIQNMRGKHESQQAYKALEGMDCLKYGI